MLPTTGRDSVASDAAAINASTHDSANPTISDSLVGNFTCPRKISVTNTQEWPLRSRPLPNLESHNSAPNRHHCSSSSDRCSCVEGCCSNNAAVLYGKIHGRKETMSPSHNKINDRWNDRREHSTQQRTQLLQVTWCGLTDLQQPPLRLLVTGTKHREQGNQTQQSTT